MQRNINSNPVRDWVLLLHFDRPVNPNFPARHYLEYAADIPARLRDHLSGDRTRTSGIMYACFERGIGFTVARVWCGATRRDEYRLRRLADNPGLCPMCNPALKLLTYFDPVANIFVTERQPDQDYEKSRYGDLDRLAPYKYKPRNRTRSNGESNRTSGSASKWREAIKASRTLPDDIDPATLRTIPFEQIDPAYPGADVTRIRVVMGGIYRLPDGTLITPELARNGLTFRTVEAPADDQAIHISVTLDPARQRLTVRKVTPPADDRPVDYGFDSDIPF